MPVSILASSGRERHASVASLQTQIRKSAASIDQVVVVNARDTRGSQQPQTNSVSGASLTAVASGTAKSESSDGQVGMRPRRRFD